MPKEKAPVTNYAEDSVPADYKCDGCGAKGCKLWREYKTASNLLCADCVAKDQEENVSDIDADGKYTNCFGHKTDRIGWYIPAVPVQFERGTYWTSTSVPPVGYAWWKKLPTKAKQKGKQ